MDATAIPMDALFASSLGALLIFLLRIVDVSMAVVRMILAVRGHRGFAAVIGFFEVLIWLVAAGHALQHLGSWLHVVGYAGGFAVGNFVGVWIEQRLALGMNAVRVVVRNNVPEIVNSLHADGYAVTVLTGRGKAGSLEILNMIVPRSKVDALVRKLRSLAPDAFVSIEDVRSAHGGYIRPGGRKMPFVLR